MQNIIWNANVMIYNNECEYSYKNCIIGHVLHGNGTLADEYYTVNTSIMIRIMKNPLSTLIIYNNIQKKNYCSAHIYLDPGEAVRNR